MIISQTHLSERKKRKEKKKTHDRVKTVHIDKMTKEDN